MITKATFCAAIVAARVKMTLYPCCYWWQSKIQKICHLSDKTTVYDVNAMRFYNFPLNF